MFFVILFVAMWFVAGLWPAVATTVICYLAAITLGFSIKIARGFGRFLLNRFGG